MGDITEVSEINVGEKLVLDGLSLDGGKIQIEHAQRVGKFQEQGRPRQIVVKLLRFKDRQSILSAARKLRDQIFTSMKTSQTSSKREEGT